jgi:DNA-binding NarL/FixJ family response regulator
MKAQNRKDDEPRGRTFWAKHTFLDIPSYGALPKEMQRETLVRFQQGADTKTIASELEVHESRVYNHLARQREEDRT